MELVVLMSLTSLVASAFAVLVAVGSAMRVQSLQHGGATQTGLPQGTRVGRNTLAPFVGEAAVDTWLSGPTLVVVAKTTCPSCHDLVSHMNRRSSDFAGFRVLMIERGRGEGESLEGKAEFAATWVKDASDRSKDIFRTNVSPHLFLIERGTVVRQQTGAQAVALLFNHGDRSASQPVTATPV